MPVVCSASGGCRVFLILLIGEKRENQAISRKVVIAIGVDKVGEGLPKLAGTSSGAREVAAWLGKPKNGYKVNLFIDESGSVERRDIFRAVQGHVESANVSRFQRSKAISIKSKRAFITQFLVYHCSHRLE